MWLCRDTSTGCQGSSPLMLKVCQLLMSLTKDSGLGDGGDMDRFRNRSLKVLHNWCIITALRFSWWHIGDDSVERQASLTPFPWSCPSFSSPNPSTFSLSLSPLPLPPPPRLSASPKWKTCGRSCHLLMYGRKSETGQGTAHQEHSFRMMNVAKHTFVRKTCSVDQHH